MSPAADTGPMGSSHRAPRRDTLVTWGLVTAGLLLVVTGAVNWWQEAPAPGPVTTDTELTDTTTTPPYQEVVSGPLPMEKRAAWEPGAPERLLVSALRIDAPVVPIRAPGGVLTPPADPQVLGWWADGARPGARRGSALVTGHTVSSGGGAMDHLEDLATGDRVGLRTDRGRLDYEVRRVVVLGKGELAQRAPRLFDQDVSGRLVLITCEDWNGVEYLSNVVVTATPVV